MDACRGPVGLSSSRTGVAVCKRLNLAVIQRSKPQGVLGAFGWLLVRGVVLLE